MILSNKNESTLFVDEVNRIKLLLCMKDSKFKKVELKKNMNMKIQRLWHGFDVREKDITLFDAEKISNENAV